MSEILSYEINFKSDGLTLAIRTPAIRRHGEMLWMALKIEYRPSNLNIDYVSCFLVIFHAARSGKV
jgi:hypothetical protein